jgi:hypothetical protein
MTSFLPGRSAKQRSKIGAAVDETSLYLGRVNVDAPIGKRWSCDGIHALCVTWHVGHNTIRPTWPEEKTAAIQDALERMSYGLEACDDPECDYCHPED